MKNVAQAIYERLAAHEVYYRDVARGVSISREQFVERLNRGDYPSGRVELLGSAQALISQQNQRGRGRLF